MTLLLLELAVRLWMPMPASRVLRGLHRALPGRPWLYALVPETKRVAPDGIVYATNGDGFRDRPFEHAKASGTFRIALIGDSVTFGYGVALDATFGRRLEERLRSGPGDGVAPRYEVLNFGVSGFNPYTEAELLHGVVLDYAPDLVLVQFCINDLNDPTQHFDASTMVAIGDVPDAAFPDPAHRQAPRASRIAAPLAALCDASRLCTLLAESVEAGRSSDEMVAALKPHDDPPDSEMAWLEALYVRMAREVRSAGGELAVVVFPYQSQLQPGGADVVQAKLRALGARAGLPVIDLLPAFRRAAGASDAAPLFLDMWHPSVRGHSVASDELFHALACEHLLPNADARSSCPGDAGVRDAPAPAGS